MDDALTAPDARHRLGSAAALLDRVLHDLKQPLNLIRVVAQDVSLDLERRRFEVAALPQALGEIRRAVDELTARLDRLRCFPGDTAPAASEPIAREELGGIVAGVGARLRPRYPRVVLTVSIAPALPGVRVEPFSLEQALWELGDNAMRAAALGASAPRVEIAVGAAENRVVITVRDNGPGIPASVRGRLFEPLASSRADAAGLGLALARRLVARGCRGDVALGSSGTSGSEFVVTLQGEA